MKLGINKLLFPEFSITVEKRLEQYILRAYISNLSAFQISWYKITNKVIDHEYLFFLPVKL